MKKKISGRKFSRNAKARRAMYNALVRALVLNGKITTTKAKSKEAQIKIDKLITLTKQGTIAARRRVTSELSNDEQTTKLLFDKITPMFTGITSGYTKSTPLNPRNGDRAQMVNFQWSKSEEIKKPAKAIKKSIK